MRAEGGAWVRSGAYSDGARSRPVGGAGMSPKRYGRSLEAGPRPRSLRCAEPKESGLSEGGIWKQSSGMGLWAVTCVRPRPGPE